MSVCCFFYNQMLGIPTKFGKITASSITVCQFYGVWSLHSGKLSVKDLESAQIYRAPRAHVWNRSLYEFSKIQNEH